MTSNNQQLGVSIILKILLYSNFFPAGVDLLESATSDLPGEASWKSMPTMFGKFWQIFLFTEDGINSLESGIIKRRIWVQQKSANGQHLNVSYLKI